ncbi:PDZ domain-containing protein [Cohnella caldifontis]|uniref:PDZ domain-containing protein n=1 Tax=Cohnella caldifontis TaxID=3027471 RepID=UPI0023ED7400|nr:PDZ domain-containing protein [Cohnella sp. YIM B05605]
MEALLSGLREAGQAVVQMLSLPYFYIALLLVWWHEAQTVKLQRKLFHVRMRGSLSVALMRLGAGMLAGIGLSIAGFGAGSALTPETLLCVWAAMVLLVLFRFRFICLAYAAGLLGVLQAVLNAVPVPDGLDGAGLAVWNAIQGIDVPGLLFLAGLLHIAEGLLVRLQGAKTAFPLFLEGKRGKPIGAHALSGVWPIPLLWLVPASGTDGFALPWTPLFGGDGDSAALWSLIAFPVVIGFSDRTETYWPEQKAKDSGNRLIVFGVILAALSAGAVYWPPLAAAASVAALVLHEGLLWISRLGEAGRQPLYVQDGTGVRILAVLPGSPAAEMGLMAGETIRKANGAATRTKEELHAALQRQSAFSKMEVANREGHLKFPQRARYAGEHHQLGLILAPDEEADFVAAARPGSIWQMLRNAGARKRGGPALAEFGAAGPEQAASVDGVGSQEAANESAALPLDPDNVPAEPTAGPAQPSGAASGPAQADQGLPPRRSRKPG